MLYFLATGSTTCTTESGIPCAIPFLYKGKYYDSCIDIDNGGVPWCYIDNTLQGTLLDTPGVTHHTRLENIRWETCKTSSCPNLPGIFNTIQM